MAETLHGDRTAGSVASTSRQPDLRDFDRSPYVAFYELTRACDLVCVHCRACAQPRSDPRELATEQSLALIEQLAEFPQPPILVLTGGDPFKRPDLFALISRAVALGLETSITPSATPLVTSDALARLRDHGVKRMAVSLDGPTATSHDAVRGVVGSFRRTLEIAADARRCGLEVQVNTTLTPTNVGEIERMADLLDRLNIVLWSVFFLVPVGRASELSRLDADECEAAFARLWRVAQTHSFGLKTTEAPHYRRFIAQAAKQAGKNERVSANARLPENSARAKSEHATSSGRPRFRPLGTNDGKGILFISHTGEIYPSGFMPIRCGEFPHDHVVSMYQQSPLFRRLRDPSHLEGKCGRCEFRNLCGGSRARAYAVTGSPFAEEPDCAFEPTGKIRHKLPAT
jgi:radical SAM protein